jgi:hypothetical protein
MWGALSDEMTGVFTIAAGPRQRSHSRVRIHGTRDNILLSQIRDFPFRRLLRPSCFNDSANRVQVTSCKSTLIGFLAVSVP